MKPANYQLPTLGQFTKVLCDCLGLWSSNGIDVEFHVPASEKARREALRSAFELIKKDNGTYGSLDELVSVTTQIAPESKQVIKKNKTIQSYVLHLAKEDYASYEELTELTGYIQIVAREKYKSSELSDLAARLYFSALLYYRELVREYSVATEGCLPAYQRFLSGTMIDLTRAISNADSRASCLIEREDISRWPLREFVEKACKAGGVSLYKFHQFHKLRKTIECSGFTDKEIWALDFSSKPISTQSKQLFERLDKGGKIKWEVVYPFLSPLSCLVSNEEDRQGFANKAFCAFVSHNLYMHASEIGSFDPNTKPHWPGISVQDHTIPISDRIDYLLLDDGADQSSINEAISAYRDLLKSLRVTGQFLGDGNVPIPGALDALYKREHLEFSSGAWSKILITTPPWIRSWILARESMLAGDNEGALQHFKAALEAAKYSAGPLFISFYIQVCAFCKAQYKMLSSIGEEQVFERFYEPLGDAASKYAGLLGYTPGSTRDPNTLMPKSNHPIKNGLIIKEIDLMAGSIWGSEC